MKHTWTRKILSLSSLLLLVPALHAQAVYAAKQLFRIQAGVGYLYLDNDYTDRKNQGLAVWADVDFTHFRAVRIGVEGEAHFGGIITPDDIGENSYLVGPRFSYQRRRVNVYGKILLGQATITNQLLNQSSTYNVVPAYGGGVEYRLTHNINLRPIDIEMQKWPNFEPNTLSPFSIVVGASYIIR